MEEKEFYSEKLKFQYALIATPIFGLLSAGFFGLFLYQYLEGQIFPVFIPNWVNLFIGIYLLRFFFLSLNFSTLYLHITSKGIYISFGVIKRKIGWDLIDECQVLQGRFRALWWRLPIDWYRGKWRNVFQIMGYPQVSLGIKNHRFKEVIFSTREPEKVKEIIENFLQGLTP